MITSPCSSLGRGFVVMKKLFGGMEGADRIVGA
jgi:hypothetical protein